MNARTCGAATLLASLIILIILTLMVVAGVNVSTVNMRIVGNVQTIKTMDSATQQALETAISQGANFSLTPTASTFVVGTDTGTVAAPVCIDSQIAAGTSAVWDMSPRDNTWHLRATITNATTGAASAINQGVQIRQLAGVCCPNC